MSFFPEYKVQNIFSRPLENFIYILLKLVFLVDTEERTTPFSLIGTLIDKCFLNENKGIKLFCCFIDFQKVFDTVWHDGLLIKLILNKIGGSFFDLISDRYMVIKELIYLPLITKSGRDAYI